MGKQREQKYRTAIYCRLSDEDYEKKREVSESIENQMFICRKYIEERPELEEAEVYIDDGHTGLDYDRAGYIRMMEDVDAGKIDCIITKSLARLGREHAETIRLFKVTFVMKRIRYIAVVDNIDFNGRITSIDIPIKVVMNDNYSMETSNNVRAALKAKAQRGEFIGSFATYGYVKDPKDKNHLIVDPVAAEVVRRIYAEFIDGKDIMMIAHGLNDDKIPCPSEYKRQNGCNYSNNRRLDKTYYWTYSTVKKILLNENENYIGNMVQHRVEKMAYNIKKFSQVEKSEWIRHEATHEPIIEQRDYDMVHKMIRHRWKQMDCSKNINYFAGLLFCGDCGRAMTKSKRKDGTILRCTTYARIGVQYCSQHLIYLQELEELVLQAIQANVNEAIQSMDFEKIRQQKLQTGINDESSRLEMQLEQLERNYHKMVMTLSQELISIDDFNVFKTEYTAQKEIIENRKKVLQKQKDAGKIYMDEYQRWLETFLQHREIKELSREVLVNLIERIDVYENNSVNITFRFKKPHQI